jgi:putative cyclase
MHAAATNVRCRKESAVIRDYSNLSAHCSEILLTRCHAQKTLRGIQLCPRWPGLPDETRKTIYWYDKRPDTTGSGFFAELFTHVGQWGTRVDPPTHFVKGLRTVDQIDPKEMILPLVVFTR